MSHGRDLLGKLDRIVAEHDLITGIAGIYCGIRDILSDSNSA